MRDQVARRKDAHHFKHSVCHHGRNLMEISWRFCGRSIKTPKKPNKTNKNHPKTQSQIRNPFQHHSPFFTTHSNPIPGIAQAATCHVPGVASSWASPLPMPWRIRWSLEPWRSSNPTSRCARRVDGVDAKKGCTGGGILSGIYVILLYIYIFVL